MADDPLAPPDREFTSLVSQVRAGLKSGEFRVAFQPIVHAQTGVLLSVECLLRWQHPTYGLLLPSSFVTAFKDKYAAQDAVRYVLALACQELANLPSTVNNPPRITVNIEPFQLLDNTLVDTIARLCVLHGIAPSLIELEVVETGDASKLLATDTFTRPLTQLGVRLAIDDFGSGYASLGTLAASRVDTVKLAGELLRDVPTSMRACTVVRATLDLLAELDVTVVAEGIETGDQLRWLATHPEVYAQGYYVGRPTTTLAKAVAIRQLCRA